MKLTDIVIRDPFVLRVEEEHCYYLFGSTVTTPGTPLAEPGFHCYRSTDLENWEGPIPAFQPDRNFWATQDFWSPEVHRYQGEYYMFASFKSPERRRGTQILRAEHPAGPYRPISEYPVTPAAWECLDGTLFVDESGKPWIVFCHEWVQIKDGTICAMPLTTDLTAAAGEPVMLFHASDAPWVRELQGHSKCFVTDGPFLYPVRGELRMLWSSMGEKGYAMGFAVSESGRITGPWRQAPMPIFREDGGHGMRFVTFEGAPMLTVHQPNTQFCEHPVFFPQPESCC